MKISLNAIKAAIGAAVALYYHYSNEEKRELIETHIGIGELREVESKVDLSEEPMANLISNFDRFHQLADVIKDDIKNAEEKEGVFSAMSDSERGILIGYLKTNLFDVKTLLGTYLMEINTRWAKDLF